MTAEIIVLKASDRYFTPQLVLDKVAEQWGEIDLDPCADPDPACLVRAELVYDARRGEDGLVLPWRGKVFCNPPWSEPAPWALRAVQHVAASSEHEVIALVNATPGAAWWARYVWGRALVCFPTQRLRFGKPGGGKPAPCPTDSAICYYGPDQDRFCEVWRPLGTIVQPRLAAIA